MRATRRVRVTGRVQGVFFRAWTRDEARRLGVSGWVRNCPDGSVEAHLDGSEQAVEQLIERLRQGPSGARVNDVRANFAEPEDLNGFEVRH
jgi:acylphosphatase